MVKNLNYFYKQDFRRQISLDIFIEVYRAYPASFCGREDLEMTNSSNNFIKIYLILSN